MRELKEINFLKTLEKGRFTIRQFESVAETPVFNTTVRGVVDMFIDHDLVEINGKRIVFSKKYYAEKEN